MISTETDWWQPLERIEALAEERDHWKAQAQSGWAALHNIREVLTVLAPPGSLGPAEHAEGPEYVHEADQFIRAIHALHERATAAEAKLDDCRAKLEERNNSAERR